MSAASNALSIIDSALPQRFEIRPFSGAVGAEIIGLDLARPVNAVDFARIHRAHLDHHVLVFRDQRISPDQQIAFSRRFGPLQIHVLKQFLLAGHPEILIVSNIIENGQNIGLGDAGKFWHSDLSWRPTLTAEQLAQVQEVIHPVVRTHPENGRKALFVSEGFTTRIVGLPSDESRDVLQQLYALSVLEQNIYRHQWQPHDLVFWDNRSLIHLATGCPAHLRRKLYRTTIQGDAPF